MNEVVLSAVHSEIIDEIIRFRGYFLQQDEDDPSDLRLEIFNFCRLCRGAKHEQQKMYVVIFTDSVISPRALSVWILVKCLNSSFALSIEVLLTCTIAA